MTQDQTLQDYWFLNGRVSVRCPASGAETSSVTEHMLARGAKPRRPDELEEGMTQDQTLRDYWFLNGRVSVRCPASGAATSSVTEHLLARGDSPPLHLHRREDEIFHILEGAVRFRVGDQEVTAGAGETLIGPKGVPHSFRVESDRARFLVITTAGDFEAMMLEVARPAGDDLPPPAEPTAAMIEALTAACTRHHIEIVGPPLAAAA